TPAAPGVGPGFRTGGPPMTPTPVTPLRWPDGPKPPPGGRFAVPSPAAVASRGIENAFARRLRVEQPICFLRLLEVPAMSEETVHLDPAVRYEARAFGLTDGGKSPRADQRDLPAQQVIAHVQCHVVTLTDEAGLAPRSNAAHGLRAGRRGGRCIQT